MKEFKGYNLIEKANILKDYNNENLLYLDGKLVLKEDKQEGYVESCEIATDEFDIACGSWACVTPEGSSAELLVKVCVDGNWSKYFSYGVWQLYKDNYYYDDADEIAHINVDEILVKNGKKASAVQYKVVLRKEGKESPKLSLVCVTLRVQSVNSLALMKPLKEIKDIHLLPETVEYSVPRLNQNMVPVIGHEMCSATTTTMLLKYRGLDFSELAKTYKHHDTWGEFEHSYVAMLVADPGHNAPTFGNWVYNTAVMGAFGFDAYVARMYSWEELKYHLAKVGPVGASIKGDTGVYKTGGHLIVVSGYKTVDGKEYVICNDPNINSRFGEGLFVRYEYPLDVFKQFWRGVAYIIE